MALQEVRGQWGWSGQGQQLMQLMQVTAAPLLLRVVLTIMMVLAMTAMMPPSFTYAPFFHIPSLTPAAAGLPLLALFPRHVLQRRL